jgi:hypothetical protein
LKEILKIGLGFLDKQVELFWKVEIISCKSSYLDTIPILTCEFSYWYNLQSWGVCNVYMELDLKVFETEKWKHRKRYWLDLVRCQFSANSLKNGVQQELRTTLATSGLIQEHWSVELVYLLVWCGSLSFTERTKGWWLGIWTLISSSQRIKRTDQRTYSGPSIFSGSLKILKNPEQAVLLIWLNFF